MKRIALVLVALALCSLPMFADDIDLANFPLGSWLDKNYDAVWEFSAGNIKIVSPTGQLYFDFAKTGIEDFKVGTTTEGPFISFKCSAVGKSYKLSKPLINTDLILEIERTGMSLYRVEMTKF